MSFHFYSKISHQFSTQSFTASILYIGKKDPSCEITKRSKHQEKSVWLVFKNARKIEMKITPCDTAQTMEQDETPCCFKSISITGAIILYSRQLTESVFLCLNQGVELYSAIFAPQP